MQILVQSNLHLIDFQNGSGSDDLDDDWAEPMEDAAGQVSAQIGKLIISKDLEKPVEERLDMLHQYFLKAKADGTLQVILKSFLYFALIFTSFSISSLKESAGHLTITYYQWIDVR